jgi:hypothetical protein
MVLLVVVQLWAPTNDNYAIFWAFWRIGCGPRTGAGGRRKGKRIMLNT